MTCGKMRDASGRFGKNTDEKYILYLWKYRSDGETFLKLKKNVSKLPRGVTKAESFGWDSPIWYKSLGFGKQGGHIKLIKIGSDIEKQWEETDFGRKLK